MLKQTQAQEMVKEFEQQYEQARKERAIEWCETVVDKAIREKAQQGINVLFIEKELKIDKDCVIEYLVKNGYTVKDYLYNQIIIKW